MKLSLATILIVATAASTSSVIADGQPPRLRTYDVNTSVTDDTSSASASLSLIKEADTTNLPEPNPDIFEPAADLDTFRNVDPSKFEWVNPDEIEAGGTTCGFLKAPFGWPAGSKTGFKESDDQTEYPLAKVYVCVRFADQQPAPRGNMAVHCGGPVEVSGCVYNMGLYPNHFGYNVIGIDQRGMGRSSPSFFVEECTQKHYEEEAGSDGGFDVDDEESIRAYARLAKARNLGCWKHPSFKVPVDEDDDTSKTYHFLEYSGTRQLAEDIERVRILFGDQKLSVYGISYGTAVFGTYTSIFPDHVNLMVLDGNMLPNYDIVQISEDFARSANQRMDYFIASCEMGNEKCAVEDMHACFKNLNKVLHDNRDYIQDKYKDNGNVQPIYQLMLDIIRRLFGNYELTPDICHAAQENDLEQLEELFGKLFQSPTTDELESTFLQDVPELDSTSKPTSSEKMEQGSNPDWPFPRYKELSSSAQPNVYGQDFSFGAYDEDMFVRFIQDMDKKYPGAGTQGPAKIAASYFSMSYYWPNTTPLSPMGNPNQKGIVAGQIYDYATPYINTQRMRENFPSADLLTSRSVNHGMNSNLMNGKYDALNEDPVCDGLIHDYFRDGEVGFVDGHVCESDPIGDSCTINDIVNGQRGDLCRPPPPESSSSSSSYLPPPPVSTM